jgi:hypothetical protein
VNGDSHLGVWFLKKSLNAGGCPAASANQFDDPNTSAQPTHSARTAGPDGIPGNGDDIRGDILILADFTQGGSIPNIKVFEWVGTGGNTDKSDGTMNDVAIGGDCIGYAHPPSPDLCATVNSTLLGPGSPNGPTWPYSPKSGAAQSFPAGSFFEGGVDLGAFGLSGECFGSVLTETRSSAEINAVLKDFVLHGFQPCESGIVTTPSSTSITLGDSVSDSAVVTGTGAGTPTGKVKFFICSPAELNASGQCETGGTQVIKATSDATGEPLSPDPTDSTKANATSDTFAPTSTGTWCWRGEYVPGAGSPYKAGSDFATTECVEVVKITPTLTTRQFVYPQDKAKITASSGGAVSGTVDFRLFGATGGATPKTALENCQADIASPSTNGLIHSETGVAVSGGLATTNNTADAVTSSGTYYWHVFFHSTNPAQNDKDGGCVENTVYTFNGDDSSITVP